jgi:hypothetical protein
MSIIRNAIIAASFAVAIAATPAMAQPDFNAEPNFGTVTLRTGFTPDPHVVAVRSGGDINAQSLSSSCAGFISSAPDVRLHFSAGSLPLIISVNSSADTTLVVNGPDGSWYCSDDEGVNGLNPMVRFNNASSGRYEIWVGTYGNASLQPAQLHISELYSQ